MENLWLVFRCVSWMQATSTSSLWSRSVSGTFLLKTPSAFHCRMLSGLMVLLWLGLFWPVAFTLRFRSLAPRIGTGWPPVALGGSFWGTGPGTPPARRDSTGRTPSRLDLKFSMWRGCVALPLCAIGSVHPASALVFLSEFPSRRRSTDQGWRASSILVLLARVFLPWG